MPSNDQLKKEITELCVELKLPVNTRGLNNEKLAELLSDLKAKKRDADTVTRADTTPVEVTVAAPAARKGVFIAEGKALTTKRGILGPGEQIHDEDLPGGAEAIAGFIKSKHLVEVS